VAQVRLFEAVARLGQALAGQPGEPGEPLVLFWTVQWAATATRDVLHCVGRRWAELGMSVLLLMNARVEAIAVDPSLARWPVGSERDLPVTRLTFARFTPKRPKSSCVPWAAKQAVGSGWTNRWACVRPRELPNSRAGCSPNPRPTLFSRVREHPASLSQRTTGSPAARELVL
jgi:hypothetical protein